MGARPPSRQGDWRKFLESSTRHTFTHLYTLLHTFTHLYTLLHIESSTHTLKPSQQHGAEKKLHTEIHFIAKL